MYYYAYAAFTSEDKSIKLLADVKGAINDARIMGAESTLSELRNMRDIVNDARLQKATTFVVVGDDETFHQALKLLLRYNDLAIGFIPFRPSTIADILGIPGPLEAPHILARRRLVRVPVGMANGTPFFSAVSLCKPKPTSAEEPKQRFPRFRKQSDDLHTVSLSIDQKTELTANVRNLSVINLAAPALVPATLRDQDLPVGKRVFKVVTEEPGAAEEQLPASLLLGEKIRVRKLKEGTFYADGAPIGPGPFDVAFSRRTLKLIVGPDRRF